MNQSLSEAQKLDILLTFQKEYNLQDTDDPAVLKMNMGGGYTLFADVKKLSWTVEFSDGASIVKYDVNSTKIPFTNAKDATALFSKYKAECKKVLPNLNGEKPSQEAQDKPQTKDTEEEKQIEEKNKLEREENERKLAELERLERAEAELEAKKAQELKSQPTEPVQKTQTGSKILDLIYEYVENDVLEVFGDTGSGKTAFVKKVAYEAAEAGKKVFYLDTERNLTKKDRELLKKCKYQYTPVIEEIDRVVQNLPAGDVVILDSVGFPVLTTFARMNMKQKGDALLKLIAIFGSLKEWAYKNNGIVLVTNQPESEFNKAPGHILRPFGDKSQFAAKEIWETIKESSNPKLTKSSIKAFRSRSVGHGTQLANMEISSSGVEVI